jgi:hypothetical protein
VSWCSTYSPPHRISLNKKIADVGLSQEPLPLTCTSESRDYIHNDYIKGPIHRDLTEIRQGVKAVGLLSPSSSCTSCPSSTSILIIQAVYTYGNTIIANICMEGFHFLGQTVEASPCPSQHLTRKYTRAQYRYVILDTYRKQMVNIKILILCPCI